MTRVIAETEWTEDACPECGLTRLAEVAGVETPDFGVQYAERSAKQPEPAAVTDYHRVNLFVGKYRTGWRRDVGDHIGLTDAKVRIVHGYDFGDGFRTVPNGDPWLVIEHGDFWPVMVRLEPEDVDELRTLGLVTTLSGTGSTTYTYSGVPSPSQPTKETP